MKHIILVIFAVIISVSLSAQKKATISGKFNAPVTFNKLYLELIGVSPVKKIDSCILADGKFNFEFKIFKPDIYRLTFNDRNFTSFIVSPGETILIESDNSDFKSNFKITGSVQSDQLVKMNRLLIPLNKIQDSIRSVSRDMPNTPENANLYIELGNQYRSADSSIKELIFSEFKKNPQSLAWVFFVNKFPASSELPRLKIIDSVLNANYAYNYFVIETHKQVLQEMKTAIGQPAPDITLMAPDSTMKSLSSLKGKVILLDFWASWCGPCRKENPNVVRIYNELHDKGFEVFSVSLDKDRKAWLNAIEKDGLVWENHVSDLKYWSSEGAAIYGVRAIPATFLIDRNGNIYAKSLRGADLENALRFLVEQ